MKFEHIAIGVSTFFSFIPFLSISSTLSFSACASLSLYLSLSLSYSFTLDISLSLYLSTYLFYSFFFSLCISLSLSLSVSVSLILFHPRCFSLTRILILLFSLSHHRDRVFSLVTGPLSDSAPEGDVLKDMHKTIKKVSTDIDKMAFNTAISNMMVFSNTLNALDVRPREAVENLVLLLAPFAPHVAEEAWELLGHSKKCISLSPWPVFDEKLCIDTTAILAIQVNGKVRGKIEVEKTISEADAVLLATEVDLVKKYVDGFEIKKIVYVPGRILNIVVGGKVSV